MTLRHLLICVYALPQNVESVFTLQLILEMPSNPLEDIFSRRKSCASIPRISSNHTHKLSLFVHYP
jgi:hypothetical protein